MIRPRFIEIDGKRYLWREIVEARRQQLKEATRPGNQPTLFPVRHDVRPAMEKRAADRYQQPGLFEA